MNQSFEKLLQGYEKFREQYASGDTSIMKSLAHYGQKPQAMVVACCDSRVDPALILQCDPGDMFVHRNVANIVPPYEHDTGHHGTSAALEFGVRFLNVKHLILLGHSQCGGIKMLQTIDAEKPDNDFIATWVSLVQEFKPHDCSEESYAKSALHQSYQNCLSFPWIKSAVEGGTLVIHRWFFDIESGCIQQYVPAENAYKPLSSR